MDVPEDASGFFSLALKLYVITECESAVNAKAEALELVRVDEETSASSLASSNLEKNDMVSKSDEGHATVERRNTDLMVLCKQVSAHETGQSKLRDAQDASSGLEAWRKSAGDHAKATERHLAQVPPQLTVAQAMLVHEKWHSMEI